MKILVADKFEQSGLDGLKALGADVKFQPDLKDDALVAAAHETEAEILVVRGTKVPAEVMEGSSIKLVIRAGAGYNTIDVATATKLGIQVANCPGKNSQAVAELAFGLMLALDRHIVEAANDLRAGKWNKKEYSKAKGLFGRTLGLVGMGMIGKEVASRAKAFGMRLLVHSSWMSEDDARAFGVERATLDQIAADSDIVSVHVSLRPETKGMLTADFFSKMKEGACFINTSRAEVVDQAALESELSKRHIRAGLDVFEGEPATGEGEYSGSLRTLPNVICTHHIGASTDQAQEAVAEETVRIAAEFANSGRAPNVVNM
jgi:D-3-phosphoglycerate dehydrogenase